MSRRTRQKSTRPAGMPARLAKIVPVTPAEMPTGSVPSPPAPEGPAPKKWVLYYRQTHKMLIMPEETWKELRHHPDYEDAVMHDAPIGLPMLRASRIALVATLWGRPALTLAVLRYYRALVRTLARAGRELRMYAVASPDEDPDWTPQHEEAVRDLVDGLAFAPNEPMGTKWNAVVELSRDCDPDAVLIVGSDDLVNPAYILAAAEYVDRGSDRVDPCTCWFYDPVHHKATHLIAARIGAGRMLSRFALEAASWKPWPADAVPNGPLEENDEKIGRVDMAQDHHLHAAGIRRTMFDPSRYPLGYDARIVDIKVPGRNIWPFESFLPGRNILAKPADPDELVARFPQFEYDHRAEPVEKKAA